MDTNIPATGIDIGTWLEAQARAAGARRVLQLGAVVGPLRVAQALPADGMLIVMENDPARAKAARADLARRGLNDRANVIAGDPSRMLHKLSGPFDVIIQSADLASLAPLQERLIGLLRPGGLLLTATPHSIPTTYTKPGGAGPDGQR